MPNDQGPLPARLQPAEAVNVEDEPEPALPPANGELIDDPRYSRPLNIGVRTDDPNLLALIQTLWDTYFAAGELGKQKGGRKPVCPYVEQLQTLITDLYLAWQEDPSLCLGIRFSQGGWNSQSRYNPRNLSKHMIVIVKTLQAARLVRVSAGSYAAPGAKTNRTTRIQASTVLQGQFQGIVVDPRAIVQVPTECIILKDGNPEDKDTARPIEYEDTDETDRMREVVEAYNSLLAQTFIDIPTLDDPWITRHNNKLDRDIKVRLGPRQPASQEDLQPGVMDHERQVLWPVVAGVGE